MLNFNNLNEEKKYKKGKFIRPGIQNLILRDISLQFSHTTSNERAVFSMETEPVTDVDWVGHEGAAGQIGNIFGNFGYYLKNEKNKEDFAGNLKDIMQAVGTYDAFLQTHGSTNFTSLTDVVAAVKPFVIGKKARYFVAAEQYKKLDNSGIGLKLKFPSKKLVENCESTSNFELFDEGKPNHFKKVEKENVSSVTNEPVTDDLPF